MDSVKKYYESRKHLNYYKKIIEIIQKEKFQSIIDVGARQSPILENLDTSLEKVVLDICDVPPLDGIRVIHADFYNWIPDKKYDIVGCFQVLEHLDEPEKFAKKLFEIANSKVLISVPYKWEKGKCKCHVQDPVDEKKMEIWTTKTPDESYIVNDGLDRLICVYNIKS
jgi:hypothetical protein